MGAFPGEQWPYAALAPSLEWTAVRALAVAIPVVAQPSRALRQPSSEHGIDHLQGVFHERVIRPPNPVSNKLKEAGIDDFARLKLRTRTRRPVIDPNHFLAAVLAVIRFARLRWPNPHRSEEHTSELQSLRH